MNPGAVREQVGKPARVIPLMPARETAHAAGDEGSADEGARRHERLAHFRATFRGARAVLPRLRSPKAYLNWARANVELLTGVATIRARPLKLTFDPTNYCQLRCPLCPTGARVHDRDQGRAQFHLFEHLMEELGEYVFLIDFFNWGEPLLNDRVEDLIALASRRDIVTFMSSNLSLPLSDARLERIIDSGLHRLIVSLDGASAQTYGVYRRQGQFDLVIDNVRRLLAARRRRGLSHPQVDWQYLVFRFNETEIDRARALAAELGVDSLTFRAPFLDEGRVPLSDSDRASIAGWAPTQPEFNRSLDASDASARRYDRCGWHYMSTAINWDGSVAPCCTVFERKDDFGSVGERGDGSYMQTVNNEKFRAVRDQFAGRSTQTTDLVCEHCPTPFLMDYHKHLNRQIFLYTAAGILDAIRHPFQRFRQRAAMVTAIVIGLLWAAGASAQPPSASSSRLGSVGLRRERVQRVLADRACERLKEKRRTPHVPTCAAPTTRAPVRARVMLTGQDHNPLVDGTVVGRQRIAASSTVGLDIVSYASDGLIVGGLLCYPLDGNRHSTVIHVHGGLDGVFSPPGDLVQTCIDWADLHGRVAFAPSLRGEDGGEGKIELCLGETDDLVNAAVMLRTLEVTDPARLGIVGGSIGACSVLGAAPRIPNLAAVVAFVPPIAWKELVQYHRTAWAPAVETQCDGTLNTWNTGGPALADAFDSLICGHAACMDSEYLARSPLPYVSVQSAPTLVVTAESDNIVPLDNQVLWSLMRQNSGATVTPISVDPCDPPGTPPAVNDVLMVARHSFHLLSPGTISSGMLFLMSHLDAVP